MFHYMVRKQSWMFFSLSPILSRTLQKEFMTTELNNHFSFSRKYSKNCLTDSLYLYGMHVCAYAFMVPAIKSRASNKLVKRLTIEQYSLEVSDFQTGFH